MKILVLQLARLGDIYMTWPALRALKRLHPDCELHFLTRSKFEAATEGLLVVDRHISMPTAFLLEPLIQPNLDMELSLQRLGEWVARLKSENYDWIINFTFSPVSSYLTHAISASHTRVTGYTRHEDGFLGIPDEVSAYFYAQAGIGGFNRAHLADLFISMLGYDYVESDWESPQVDGRDFGLPESYILVHIGASEERKTLPPFKWARVLKNFFDHNRNVPVVMIGSAQERALGEAIEAGVSRGRVVNLIGQTRLREIFHLLKGARLLVGADSAPMHMASLTNTPCLNISFESVHFWETGPKASRSFIYKVRFPDDVVSEELGAYIHQILDGESPAALVQRSGGLESYQVPQDSKAEVFAWKLVQAIYLGGDFPVTENLQFCQAIEKLYEVNDVARRHIQQIPDKGLEVLGPLLDRADEVMEAVAKMVPAVAPIVKWYQTEKVRIPVASQEEVARQTLEIHEKLRRILSVYMLEDSIKVHESNIEE